MDDTTTPSDDDASPPSSDDGVDTQVEEQGEGRGPAEMTPPEPDPTEPPPSEPESSAHYADDDNRNGPRGSARNGSRSNNSGSDNWAGSSSQRSEGSSPSRPARVPPSNLRAEESVLGAMLLSREAIADVVEVLETEHFYKPIHGHVFDAILSLYGAGQPVDAVTVAEELVRANLLEAVGGPGTLIDLQAGTPAVSNAAYYAKIVEDHALLRRLITVSNEIAEIAYEVPEDVVGALDDAESKMFDVAEKRLTNTTAEIKDLLGDNLDRLEALYEQGDAITGLETGLFTISMI